uniref:cDNA FLJ26129 fis, clone TMS02971 n=1 Tax=Homo sapiens TaxID=9606 RepID=Q6ZPB4_HUMAN|nr:unnamed protein product [Homo sapiens]
MQLNLEELQKKLEMTELLLQQFSSRCEAPDANQQLQQAMEERAQLEAHLGQVMESVRQLQMERDKYAENLKGESAMWRQRMQQMSEQVHTLREEKECQNQQSPGGAVPAGQASCVHRFKAGTVWPSRWLCARGQRVGVLS